MKRSRFTEEQIVSVLKEHEAGIATADLCRKHGISQATFYNWKAKFGGLEVSEAKRLKGLEDENARLKKLLAEAMLDNAALKDLLSKKMLTPAAKREAVAHMRTRFAVSERRVCSVIEVDRMMVRYRSTRSDGVATRIGTAHRGFYLGPSVYGSTGSNASTNNTFTSRAQLPPLKAEEGRPVPPGSGVSHPRPE
jgi:putative transposase